MHLKSVTQAFLVSRIDDAGAGHHAPHNAVAFERLSMTQAIALDTLPVLLVINDPLVEECAGDVEHRRL